MNSKDTKQFIGIIFVLALISIILSIRGQRARNAQYIAWTKENEQTEIWSMIYSNAAAALIILLSGSFLFFNNPLAKG